MGSMNREFTFEYSPTLVRIAVRRFLSRYAKPSLFAALVLLCCGTASLYLTGDRVWWLAIIAPILYAAWWSFYYSSALRILNEMQERRMTIRFDDESLTFQSA